MMINENKVMRLRNKYANEDKLPKRIRIVASFLKEEFEEDACRSVLYYKYEELSDIKEGKANCIEECYE